MTKRLKIIADDKIPFLRGRLEPVADIFYLHPSEISASDVKDADILIVRTRTRCDEALLKDSSVKLVVTATIGTDHIDTAWCAANGITVRNAAGCNAPGVAQYVWSSLLRLGFDPRHQVLGVVGKGNVGSIVVGWGRMLGCRTLVCDPPRMKRGVADEHYLPLQEILRECDAVTLHTPLTNEGEDATLHLIGGRELAMMKPGSILVNASRGGVTDNREWLRHIRENNAKAVIDTWENEPDIDHTLLSQTRIASPHIAGYSLEGKQRATRMALEAVEQEFGICIDKSGLAPDYQAPVSLTEAEIVASYDPFADTEALRNNPGAFESLRGNYHYRPEVG